MKINLPKIDPKQVEEEIITFLCNKVKTMEKTGIVIGVSGGVDSAVCAILSKKAMDTLGYNTLGAILPGSYSQEAAHDNTDAVKLCNKFNISYITYPLVKLIENTTEVINHISHTTEVIESVAIKPNKVVLGNMASRIRSNILHTIAECQNSLVCGTGNWDEDFGVGYYTLFGDGAVHMSPIGRLSKRLVYQMAEYLGVPKTIIKKTPSARLEEGQTDSGDLGYGYDAVEIFSEILRQHGSFSDHMIAELLGDYAYSSDKFANLNAFISDLLYRHQIAVKKASLVSPDIAKVTLRY